MFRALTKIDPSRNPEKTWEIVESLNGLKALFRSKPEQKSRLSRRLVEGVVRLFSPPHLSLGDQQQMGTDLTTVTSYRENTPKRSSFVRCSSTRTCLDSRRTGPSESPSLLPPLLLLTKLSRSKSTFLSQVHPLWLALERSVSLSSLTDFSLYTRTKGMR